MVFFFHFIAKIRIVDDKLISLPTLLFSAIGKNRFWCVENFEAQRSVFYFRFLFLDPESLLYITYTYIRGIDFLPACRQNRFLWWRIKWSGWKSFPMVRAGHASIEKLMKRYVIDLLFAKWRSNLTLCLSDQCRRILRDFEKNER